MSLWRGGGCGVGGPWGCSNGGLSCCSGGPFFHPCWVGHWTRRVDTGWSVGRLLSLVLLLVLLLRLVLMLCLASLVAALLLLV